MTDPEHDYAKDARIHAAAPELYAALCALMDMRDQCFIPNDGNWWDYMALCALAKAEGKENPYD